ncbi:MAG: ParB N-terminal domain-containing protein, partial [Clostridiaceae bacterium]
MASSKGKLPKGKKTRFEAFTTAEISRRDLKGAQYNPRRIDDKAKERLREGINRVGMVQPVVWNKRTGNIVGGHQRIEQLDALEGNDEYSLTVAVVDVDETREKELNILLNNPQAQGDWDLERLKKLLEDEEIDLKSTGFDPAEVFKLFGDQAE